MNFKRTDAGISLLTVLSHWYGNVMGAIMLLLIVILTCWGRIVVCRTSRGTATGTTFTMAPSQEGDIKM